MIEQKLLSTEEETGGLTLRRTVVSDVPKMAAIINGFASDALMLPRSLNSLYQHIRDFVVIEANGVPVACGALQVVWQDMAEIRSLAVDRSFHGKGLGSRIVSALLDEAKGLGVGTMFTLTYEPGFFGRFGFTVVSRDSLPHKIWADCLDCPKFPNCDETAMTLELEDKETTSEG